MSFITTMWTLNSVNIALLELIATVIGGLFALLLLYRGNQDKKLTQLLNIYDRLYSDPDIAKALYAIDKGSGLEELASKQVSEKYHVAALEMETDKLLKYLDFIGALVKTKKLSLKDLKPFSYELSIINDNVQLTAYRNYLSSIKVNLNNLHYLLEEFP
ncbi:hypothetical protein [Pedobacter endophyticus]|uniref:Uncharacterized protein n=1 Tax=Pedobacter endophyticus TaxID=2789740 RepID=A0A7S9L162_9SPHI|nr:hypothetical protein [Pedobacter endophyticus]QPH40574.1 hypothetical protein IZT61_04655 [Pedobacter endophyticus]